MATDEEQIKTVLERPEHGFECVEQIGLGAYAIVVKAKCRKEDKTYAIKKLKINVESERLKYPMRELEALMTFKLSEEERRNVIEYHKFWIDKIGGVDQLFIQMELCSVDLWKFIYNNKIGGPKIIQNNSSPRFYQQVFQQVLNGLSFIHKKGWVHRDIHPRNILIANPNPEQIIDIHIKIADFGLAKKIRMDISTNLTVLPKLEDVSPLFPKSAPFRAPELKTDRYNFKVDVYSAGLVLYFISHYLEDEDSWFSELDQLKKGELNVDERLFHNEDKKLSGLIKNLIQEDPSARLSAREAMDYMSPKAKDATDSSMPSHIGFLARKENEDVFSQCILKKPTLSIMKEAIYRHICVPEGRQRLRQKRMVNGEPMYIKIESNEDVEDIIEVASKCGQEVVIVVSEKEEDEMTEMSAEQMRAGDMAEAMATLSTSASRD